MFDLMPGNGTQKKKGSAGTNQTKTNGKSFAAERINPGNRDQQESKREKMLEYSKRIRRPLQKTPEKAAVNRVNNLSANGKAGQMPVEGKMKFNRNKVEEDGEKVASNTRTMVVKGRARKLQKKYTFRPKVRNKIPLTRVEENVFPNKRFVCVRSESNRELDLLNKKVKKRKKISLTRTEKNVFSNTRLVNPKVESARELQKAGKKFTFKPKIRNKIPSTLTGMSKLNTDISRAGTTRFQQPQNDDFLSKVLAGLAVSIREGCEDIEQILNLDYNISEDKKPDNITSPSGGIVVDEPHAKDTESNENIPINFSFTPRYSPSNSKKSFDKWDSIDSHEHRSVSDRKISDDEDLVNMISLSERKPGDRPYVMDTGAKESVLSGSSYRRCPLIYSPSNDEKLLRESDLRILRIAGQSSKSSRVGIRFGGLDQFVDSIDNKNNLPSVVPLQIVRVCEHQIRRYVS